MARNHRILHMAMNEWMNNNSLHTSSYTSFHSTILYAQIFYLLNILCSSILYSFNHEFNQQLYDVLTVDWFQYMNFNFILLHTTLKIATRVSKTCWWLLCNERTFIHSSAIVGLL
jgi:hypothetical protein